MPAKPIPDGYHTVTPYIIVKGVDRLMEFLKQAFDAQEKERLMRPDGTVMHAEMRIGDSVIMMGEAGGPFTPMPASIHLYVNDADATYKRALQAGGTSLMEPSDQFYGDRNGGVKDAFGNHWWISTHKEDLSSEELKKRTEDFFAKQKQRASADGAPR
jgi:PhnB protein